METNVYFNIHNMKKKTFFKFKFNKKALALCMCVRAGLRCARTNWWNTQQQQQQIVVVSFSFSHAHAPNGRTGAHYSNSVECAKCSRARRTWAISAVIGNVSQSHFILRVFAELNVYYSQSLIRRSLLCCKTTLLHWSEHLWCAIIKSLNSVDHDCFGEGRSDDFHHLCVCVCDDQNMISDDLSAIEQLHINQLLGDFPLKYATHEFSIFDIWDQSITSEWKIPSHESTVNTLSTNM